MKRYSKTCWLVLFLLISACVADDGDQAPLLIFSEQYDFNESEHNWIHGFADYPAGPDDSLLFDLTYAYTDEVSESKLTKKSVMLSGKNLNRDLFMFLKKKIGGLEPSTEYTITFSVELASNLHVGYVSAGSAYLKAGAIHKEPKSVIENGEFVMNIDKGDDGIAGQDMISLGDIATPSTNTGYAMVTRNNTMSNARYVAKTNANGELWLIIGTDSNVEGLTTVFYTKVNVVFSKS